MIRPLVIAAVAGGMFAGTVLGLGVGGWLLMRALEPAEIGTDR